MSAAARVEAPAKVNLYLRVVGRRDDGFHDLDTLFQTVCLADDVEVRAAPSGVRLDVDGADLGPETHNLAYRAAVAYLAAMRSGGAGAGEGEPATKPDFASAAVRDLGGARVRLHKRIPAGAGLGGGSSDAAAVLRCLDALSGGAVPAPVLHTIAAGLGSDVPFFLGPTARARGTGRGELLDPLEPLPERPLVIILPPVHVATGEAYSALARERALAQGTQPAADAPALGAHPSSASGPPRSWADVERVAHNDFQGLVTRRHPEVRSALEALRAHGARAPLLSGSGSACFGHFTEEATAHRAAAALEQALGWPCVSTRTRTTLPAVRIENAGRG